MEYWERTENVRNDKEATNLHTLICQLPASLARSLLHHRAYHRGPEHEECLLGVKTELLWDHRPCSQRPGIQSADSLMSIKRFEFRGTDFITPKKSISLLPLGSIPDGQQLL